VKTKTVSAVGVTIEPAKVFDSDGLCNALGIRRATIAREVRLGRLRVSRRAGRYFFLGSWIIAWLESGESKVAA